MRVVENVPLAPLTTLRLGGPARRLVTVESEAEVAEALRDLDARREPVLVLGGGSNLVVSDDGWDGTVLRMATLGIAEGADATDEVTAAAGEPWDAFVEQCVRTGRSGVECLSGIPGLVGAVPMQNVGAYGQDVSETITRVRTWDRDASRVVDFDRAACGFAYRSSVFRGKDRHVILSVTFALPRDASSAPIRYTELARALGVNGRERAPLARVRETVIALRRTKGMVLDASDPDTASAGSFFTNPILDADALAKLRARVAPLLAPGESMPVFAEEGGRTKVAAGWLIERAGFQKGFAMGPVAISSKHALALTNRGGATTQDLLALARTIRDGVLARLGVRLENEPVLVGAPL